MREQYVEMMAHVCEDMYDTAFTFNSLQDSGLYLMDGVEDGV